MSVITSSLDSAIATLTLNNPKRRNALSSELIDALLTALSKAETGGAHVVVLRAAKDAKIWSAGHDIDELPEGGRDPLGWDDPLRNLVRSIENCPIPVIAMIEGGVWGGACEVVLACDMVIAAPSATFAITPARLGVPYNVSGMMTFMNNLGLHLLKEMAFTALPISAERGLQVGFVNHVIPATEVEAFTYELAHAIARNAPLSIRVMKEQLRVLSGAHPLTPRGFEKVQGLRRTVYDSNDYREGIRAFKEKREPKFTGS